MFLSQNYLPLINKLGANYFLVSINNHKIPSNNGEEYGYQADATKKRNLPILYF